MLGDVYGKRLHITASTAQADKHVRELGTIPRRVHRVVSKFFDSGGSTIAGIYVGEGNARQVAPYPYSLALQGRPRGWLPGRTFDDVPGVFMDTFDMIIIGDEDKHPHGSSSLPVHEFGHALDKAVGRHSQSEQWRDAVETLLASSSLRINPYYTRVGNPDGWLDEAYAEAFAAWSKGAADGQTPELSIFNALGRIRSQVEMSPEALGAARSMIDHFESIGK